MTTDELIALLRDALNGDPILSSLERDAIIARVIASAARAAELEADNKRLEALVIGWLDHVTGPDEMGAYIHQRQLVEASSPIKARVCVRNALGAA